MLLKKKKTFKYIIDNIEISSDSDRKSSDRGRSAEENFQKENSDEENSDEKIKNKSLIGIF